jgi:hypothetical protein
MRVVNRLLDLSEDTLFRGVISGLSAGLLKDIINVILFVPGIIQTGFWNYTSIVAFNKTPQSAIEFAIAIILELIFSAFLGVIFIILVNNLKTKHYVIFGLFYGSLVWFFIKTMILTFNITKLEQPAQSIANPLVHLGLSMVFGLILAIIDHQLRQNSKPSRN